jgi:hypothetical protein
MRPERFYKCITMVPRARARSNQDPFGMCLSCWSNNVLSYWGGSVYKLLHGMSYSTDAARYLDINDNHSIL